MLASLLDHLPTCMDRACRGCVVRQPPGSSVCGPACVATVVGVSLETAVVAVGTRGATSARLLATALARYGYHLGRAQCAPYGVLPPSRPGVVAHLLRLNWGRPRPTHWALLRDGHVLDPAHGVDPHLQPGRSWPPRTRVMSSYPITRDGEGGT